MSGKTSIFSTSAHLTHFCKKHLLSPQFLYIALKERQLAQTTHRSPQTDVNPSQQKAAAGRADKTDLNSEQGSVRGASLGCKRALLGLRVVLPLAAPGFVLALGRRSGFHWVPGKRSWDYKYVWEPHDVPFLLPWGCNCNSSLSFFFFPFPIHHC